MSLPWLVSHLVAHAVPEIELLLPARRAPGHQPEESARRTVWPLLRGQQVTTQAHESLTFCFAPPAEGECIR